MRLFAQHESMVHGFIVSLEPSWNDAAEILQETSLAIWRKFDEFEHGTNFLRWSCRIAEFEVRRFRARRKRERLQFSDELLGRIAEARLEEGDSLTERRRALTECIKKLSESDRRLLLERYAANRQGKQIAERLGRPADSIYKALKRVRAALYNCISRTLAREAR